MNLSKILLIIASIFAIAACAIGIDCFNKCPTIKTEKKNNFNFLILCLVVSILSFIVGVVSMFMGGGSSDSE